MQIINPDDRSSIERVAADPEAYFKWVGEQAKHNAEVVSNRLHKSRHPSFTQRIKNLFR